MSVSIYDGMDGCYISGCSAYPVGMLVDCDTPSGHYWFGYNNGWHCTSFGILFNHALVENTMAKLKYVLSSPLCYWQMELLPFLIKIYIKLLIKYPLWKVALRFLYTVLPYDIQKLNFHLYKLLCNCDGFRNICNFFVKVLKI